MKSILTMSEELNKYLDKLAVRFQEDAIPIGDSEQFEKMKKETTPIFDLLEIWEESTLALIKQRELTLHPQQIIATKENYEMLLMHSYYKDIRIRKYNETNKSSHYILEQIIRELENEGTIN